MSKSLGNLITPSQLLGSASSSQKAQTSKQQTQPTSKKSQPTSLLDRNWPVDVLRLWVASSDYTYDISLGLQQLLKVSRLRRLFDSSGTGILSETSQYKPIFAFQSFRFRSSQRFGSLFTLISIGQMVSQPSFLSFHQNHTILRSIHFYRCVVPRFSFCHSDIARWFRLPLPIFQPLTLISLKTDFMFVAFIDSHTQTDAPNSTRRRASQTVLRTILDVMPRLMAPITPFLSEEIYSSLKEEGSIFQNTYVEPNPEWKNEEVEAAWSCVESIRGEVNKELEKLKKEGIVKSALDVDLSIITGTNGKLL